MGELVPSNEGVATSLATARDARVAMPALLADGDPMSALVAYRRSNSHCPSAMVVAVAKELGCSARQVQRKVKRLLEAERAGGITELANRSKFELTDDHLEVIFAHAGNVQAAWRDLKAQDETLPTYQTFWARWSNDVPPDVRAFATSGADGMRMKWLYAPYTAPARNDVWQADHVELPIDTIPRGRLKPLKPWLTAFIDDKTRMIMSWAITAEPDRRPDTETVTACIADAISLRRVDNIDIGGVPGGVRWDQGAEFLSGSVTALAAAVGFEARAVPPYSGHLKGKIERLWLTIEREFCTTINGFTHAPKTYTNKDPFRAAGPIDIALLEARFAIWVEQYNMERAHSALDGRTPFEAWVADGTPLRTVADATLRSGLIKDTRERKVQKKGVFFQGHYWLGAGVGDLVDKLVTVSYPVRANTFIEVYHRDRWICTAWPADQLSEEEQRRIREQRNAHYREARDLQDRADARRTAAHEATTADWPELPPISSMPSHDPLAGRADDLWDLAARLVTEAGSGENSAPEVGEPPGIGDDR